MKEQILLDTLLFFEEDCWYFVEDPKFIINNFDVNFNVNFDVNDLINIGLELADNLNKMNIDVSDYDFNRIEDYLK